MGGLGHLTPSNEQKHIPVLLAEVLVGLAVHSGGDYLDATVGGGGHSLAILKKSEPDGRVLGLDIDPEAIERASSRLKSFGSRCRIVHTSYQYLLDTATEHGFLPLDGVLFDLGFSSWQIENPNRGFSHRLDGPLDMRYDSSSQFSTAEAMVNTLSARELADLIWRYGEEKQSRRIAIAIVEARPIISSLQLANVIADAVTHKGSHRLHPATKTFQAIRIAVNDELVTLEKALPQAIRTLRPGGRLAVISFHSLEDRIVKQFMKLESQDCICPPENLVCTCNHRRSLHIVTRRVVTPTAGEMAVNPRSRSAKLRVAEKLSDAS
jgi:16S rRNA (cytosine1402-N4)-methyltransferase